MASKYDLSHIGKRALERINRNGGDTFLDKVIASRMYADGLNPDGTVRNPNGIRKEWDLRE